MRMEYIITINVTDDNALEINESRSMPLDVFFDYLRIMVCTLLENDLKLSLWDTNILRVVKFLLEKIKLN